MSEKSVNAVKVVLTGIKRTVTQSHTLTVNPETPREDVFALVSGVSKIQTIQLTDSTGKAVTITPQDFTAKSGKWSLKGVKVDNLAQIDRHNRVANDKIVLREDVNYIVSRVLHAMDNSYPEYNSREFGGELSEDTRELILGLHAIGKTIDDIVANKRITVKRDTIESVINGQSE